MYPSATVHDWFWAGILRSKGLPNRDDDLQISIDEPFGVITRESSRGPRRERIRRLFPINIVRLPWTTLNICPVVVRQ